MTFKEVVEKDLCRYIDKEGKFCDEERKDKSSYCEEHHKKCHTGVKIGDLQLI